MAITPHDIQYSDKGSTKKTPMILAGVVAVFAGGVAIWGANSSGLTAGIPTPPAPWTPPATVAPPADKPERERLLKSGWRLHQERCAGCHAVDNKLVGPSYDEICRKYGQPVAIPGSPSPGVDDQIETSAISAISFAVMHPKGVWDGYDLGPQLSLTDVERRSVAFWIFNHSKDKDETDE